MKLTLLLFLATISFGCDDPNSTGNLMLDSKIAKQNELGPEKSRQLIVTVQKLVDAGYVLRIDGFGDRVYWRQDVWEGLDVNQKETMLRAFSTYRQLHDGLPQTTFLGSVTGRELASYGPMQGMKFN